MKFDGSDFLKDNDLKGFEIKCATKYDGNNIISDVFLSQQNGCIENIRNTISRRVIEIENEAVKKSLMMLGWKPPILENEIMYATEISFYIIPKEAIFENKIINFLTLSTQITYCGEVLAFIATSKNENLYNDSFICWDKGGKITKTKNTISYLKELSDLMIDICPFLEKLDKYNDKE